MEGNNPKISFIPKGSLIREESFLERRRPQSMMGIIAGFVFILVVGAYAGLYYLNDSLNKKIAEKTDEINKAQQEFKNAPEVEEARVFRVRADLAREILNTHTVVSPVFAFLSKNTTESIMYDNFSFQNDKNGTILNLTGEAPTYAALAYQADVFRSQKEQLSMFSVKDVSLTKFGTVTFAFSMVFSPHYLLYTKNLNSVDNPVEQEVVVPVTSATTSGVQTPETSVTDTPFSAVTPATTTSTLDPSVVDGVPIGVTSTTTGDTLGNAQGDWGVVSTELSTSTSTAVAPEKQSFLRLLWSKFKFW